MMTRRTTMDGTNGMVAEYMARREAVTSDTGPPRIAHPGDVLAEGEGYRWIAYRLDGETVAALYVAGHLLRRDHRGWWVADYRGKRHDVKGDPVDRLGGTAPVGWPLHPEHVEMGGGDDA